MEEIRVESAEQQSAAAGFDEVAGIALGLHLTDLRALGLLIFRGALSPTALADAMNLSPGATTTVIDRLEEAGYARRVRPKEGDRRRLSVEHTELAKKKCGALWGPLATRGAERLATFSHEELEAILRYLKDGRELYESLATELAKKVSR